MVNRKNGRSHGEVFTHRNVVQYILDEVGYTSDSNLSAVSILEPSAGSGVFATSIIDRLYASSKIFGFSLREALLSNVRLIELDQSNFKVLLQNIHSVLTPYVADADFVCRHICLNTDFLKYSPDLRYDCIAGNPPYIRHELISAEDKKIYKAKFRTFRDRADLYIAFFEHSLRLLKKNGRLSFICSNRWLYNQYGKGLREMIAKKYHLGQLLNIESSSPFDEKVIAYPCITTIKNNEPEGKTLYCENNAKIIDFDDLIFSEIDTPKDASWQNIFLSYDINHHTLSGILDQGFKIGIGVATGSDKVFIVHSSDIHNIEQDRLLPLITARDLRNNEMKWGGLYVVNPYENDHLCDLEKYPGLKVYLNRHKDALLKRHTAQKSPHNWYKTIDKINPEIQRRCKILLPDLSGNKVLFIDQGQYYPHHNIYYVTGRDIGSLKILACILMSDFVKDQISQIGIRMNGGLPRFQAQVLKKIKVPDIDFIETEDQKLLVSAYDNTDFNSLNNIINKYCSNIGEPRTPLAATFSHSSHGILDLFS